MTDQIAVELTLEYTIDDQHVKKMARLEEPQVTYSATTMNARELQISRMFATVREQVGLTPLEVKA